MLSFVNHQDNEGETALHYAVDSAMDNIKKNGREGLSLNNTVISETIQKLIHNGANLYVVNQAGETPLSLASPELKQQMKKTPNSYTPTRFRSRVLTLKELAAFRIAALAAKIQDSEFKEDERNAAKKVIAHWILTNFIDYFFQEMEKCKEKLNEDFNSSIQVLQESTSKKGKRKNQKKLRRKKK